MLLPTAKLAQKLDYIGECTYLAYACVYRSLKKKKKAASQRKSFQIAIAQARQDFPADSTNKRNRSCSSYVCRLLRFFKAA